jgi:septal ring-binding cell division protein DamX
MNAQDMKKRLSEKKLEVCILKLTDNKERAWYVVQVGEFAKKDDIKPALEILQAERVVAVVKPITEALREQRTRCQ